MNTFNESSTRGFQDITNLRSWSADHPERTQSVRRTANGADVAAAPVDTMAIRHALLWWVPLLAQPAALRLRRIPRLAWPALLALEALYLVMCVESGLTPLSGLTSLNAAVLVILQVLLLQWMGACVGAVQGRHQAVVPQRSQCLAISLVRAQLLTLGLSAMLHVCGWESGIPSATIIWPALWLEGYARLMGERRLAVWRHTLWLPALLLGAVAVALALQVVGLYSPDILVLLNWHGLNAFPGLGVSP